MSIFAHSSVVFSESKIIKKRKEVLKLPFFLILIRQWYLKKYNFVIGVLIKKN